MMYLVLLLLALAVPAGAQGPTDPPRPLSLAEALQIAEENNPAYHRALGNVRLADAEVRRSRGAFLPSLNVSLSTGSTANRQVTAIDEFGRIDRLDDPAETTSSSSGQSVSLGIPLFEGGSRLREMRAANASARASRLGVEEEAVRLRAELARRYYDAVRAERAIELEEQLLATARDQLEITRRQLRVAASSPVDVLGAEVDLARQEQAVENARGEARKAMLALGEEMGVVEEVRLRLTDDPPAPADPGALNADALAERALANAPRIARLDAELSAATQRCGAARASRWPEVSGSVSYSRGIFGLGSEGLFELNPLNESLRFGLSINLPVFDGWQRSASIAQADVQYSAAQEDLRAARLAIEREVRSALIDLENAYHNAELAERAAALATERLELAQEQYLLGAISFTELQQVVEQAAQAERDALTAHFDYAAARVTLEETVGSPGPTSDFPLPRS